MYGKRCENCSGEDCACCEVYREYETSCRTERHEETYDEYDERSEADFLNNIRECDKCGEEGPIFHRTNVNDEMMWLCDNCIRETL